jgi:hypothetical protein
MMIRLHAILFLLLTVSTACFSASAAEQAPAQGFATYSADVTTYDEATKTWKGTGNVVFRYRTYTLKADTAEYDQQRELVTARGAVSLNTGRSLVTTGPDGLVMFSLKERTWTTNGVYTEYQAEGMLEPYRITAERARGGRERLSLENARVTTCAPESEQWLVLSRELTLVPDRRLTAKRASFFLFGERMAELSSLSLPIRRGGDDRPAIVPTVGQSNEEGFYIKTALNYSAGKGQTGVARLDLLQKKGIGLGATHNYRFSGSSGEASLYGIAGSSERNISASLRHKQKVLGFDTTIGGELRKNSYLYMPGSSSSNVSVAMDRTVEASHTTLSYRTDESSSSAYSYRNTTAALGQTYRYSRKGMISVGYDTARQSAPMASVRIESARGDISQGLPAVDATLSVNTYRTSDGDATGVFKPVQRQPELTLKTDALRLGFTKQKFAPVAFEASHGRIKAEGKTSDRTVVAAQAPQRRLSLNRAKRPTTLDVSGGFRQAVYASDAMQYTISANLKLTQPFARSSDFAVSYNYQQPRGYSPFRFDRPFKYNLLAATTHIGSASGWEFRAGSGYDFQNDVAPWRDVLLTTSYRSGERLRFATNVAVNVNGKDPGQKSNIRYVNSGLRARYGKFTFDGESRYIPSTGRFGRLLGHLNTPIGDDWSVRVLAGRDSGQKYRRLMLTRHFGCVETSIIGIDDRGWRNDRGIRILVRLTAFPMQDIFESGMFGERVEIGTPDVGL